MIDRIGNQPLTGDDTQVHSQSPLTGIQAASVGPVQHNPSPTELSNRIIDDAANISPAAKEKLEQFEAVRPYVNQLQTTEETVNTGKVAQFKSLLANGGIQEYLDSVIGNTTDALLNSPTGKSLTVSL